MKRERRATESNKSSSPLSTVKVLSITNKNLNRVDKGEIVFERAWRPPQVYCRPRLVTPHIRWRQGSRVPEAALHDRTEAAAVRGRGLGGHRRAREVPVWLPRVPAAVL